MTFKELIEKEVKEKLKDSKEGERLAQLTEQKRELNNLYYNIRSRNLFPLFTKSKYDIYDFSDAQKFVDEYEGLREELVEKNKKAIFKRKTINQIKYIDEKYIYCMEKLKELKKYEDAKQDYGNGDKEILDIKYKIIRQILKENRDEPVVEDAFIASIRKDGDSGHVNNGTYDEIAYDETAYEIIDLEVTKMLMKTKYKEKLDDLKTQLEEREVEDTDSEK